MVVAKYMSAPEIKCPECNGVGRVKMTRQLQSCYSALKRIQPATVAQFSKAIKKELTLSHHFMARLVGSGVARKVSTKMPAKYETV
jgi:hypothetical protein